MSEQRAERLGDGLWGICDLCDVSTRAEPRGHLSGRLLCAQPYISFFLAWTQRQLSGFSCPRTLLVPLLVLQFQGLAQFPLLGQKRGWFPWCHLLPGGSLKPWSYIQCLVSVKTRRKQKAVE